MQIINPERLREQYNNATAQLEKLEQKVADYEKTSRSTDSFELEKDSGISGITGNGSKSTFDRTGNVKRFLFLFNSTQKMYNPNIFFTIFRRILKSVLNLARKKKARMKEKVRKARMTIIMMPNLVKIPRY